jgi:plasmid stabilization system protein ParE
MKERRVKVGPRAAADLRRIGRYIAHFGMPLTAERYVERLGDFIMRLDLAAERGEPRPDIFPTLRVIPFETSATIAAIISDDTVTVMRVFYRGQNWERALRRDLGRRS